MKTTLTSEIEIRGRSKTLDKKIETTRSYYQTALEYIIPKILKNWTKIDESETTQDKQRQADHLFHATKSNPKPDYPAFDQEFPRMPCYIRRSLMSDAIGIIQSWGKQPRQLGRRIPRNQRKRSPTIPKA